ncbi:MAG TPA: hypothetical protein VKR06_40810 [Ktedonosporobacter sp.]|nr:hypothetical protein [Ktedonosporobacter sp.]
MKQTQKAYRQSMQERRIAYTTFERMILGLYEQKMLTADLLNLIARHYHQIGIDSAGSLYVQTRDGKDLHQICIALLDPTFPIVARGSSEDHEEYWEQELKQWQEIVDQHWNWQAYGAIFPIQSQQDHAA